MSTQRFNAAAAPLPDGRVLVTGGFNTAALQSAEVFNPQTNSFSSAGIGSMGTARFDLVAAPLSGGRVLVAGGSPGFLTSAEIFATSNAFTTKLKGKTLIVSVVSAGSVTVTGASTKGLAKKKKKKLLLKASSAAGGPGEIKVKLNLTSTAKAALKQKRKLKLSASVTFSPAAGFANTQTAKLKLKRKKK
jgi:hypothetical protein